MINKYTLMSAIGGLAWQVAYDAQYYKSERYRRRHLLRTLKLLLQAAPGTVTRSELTYTCRAARILARRHAEIMS